MRLKGGLVHDRLDGLVDVVVDVLAGDDRDDGRGALALDADDLVLVLGGLLGQTALGVLLVVVVELAVLHRNQGVVVLLGQKLLIMDGLDGGVVVVLVHLTVERGRAVLVVCLGDGLVGHGRSDALVHGGVVVAGAGPADVSFVL